MSTICLNNSLDVTIKAFIFIFSNMLVNCFSYCFIKINININFNLTIQHSLSFQIIDPLQVIIWYGEMLLVPRLIIQDDLE